MIVFIAVLNSLILLLWIVMFIFLDNYIYMMTDFVYIDCGIEYCVN